MYIALPSRVPCWAFVAVLILLPLGAQAGQLTGLSANPNPVQAGATVTLSVQKSGSNCGFKINLGNGIVEGPFVFPSGNHRQLQRSFPQAGSYTIKIWGRKKGSKAACGGGERTLLLTVQGGSSSGARIRSEIGLKSRVRAPKKARTEKAVEFAVTPIIKKVRPESGSTIMPGYMVRIEGTSFGTTQGKVFFRIPGILETPRELENIGWISATDVLGTIPQDVPRDFPIQSTIEFRIRTSSGRVSSWFHPPYGVTTRAAMTYATSPKIRAVTSPDGIAPGHDVVIEGMTFGDQQGWVVIRLGDDGQDVVIPNIIWESSKRIRVTIPEVLGIGMRESTYASFRVSSKAGKRSAWYTTPFDVSIVEVPLLWSSGAIHARECGHSDKMACNGWTNGHGLRGQLTDQAIRGYHARDWGKLGNQTGADEYRIRLANNWKISGIQAHFSKTSDDEFILAPTPSEALQAFAGKSEATIRVGWTVSPADHLVYEYKIWIKGPSGLPHYCKDRPFCDP